MPIEEIATRLGLAMLLGGLIGLERQWRSHYVGLRTIALVTVGAAAMIVFGLMLPLPAGSDPSAIVHIISGVITGVGFLGAGVIIQEGVTAKGFSTAATLWCSTAVGMFAGAGMMEASLLLAAIIIVVNLFLRPVVHVINRYSADDVKPQRKRGEKP